MAVASGRYFLILNADAWMTEGSLGRLVGTPTRIRRRRWSGRAC